MSDILVVCKETDLKTDKCIIYDIGYLDKDKLNVQCLQLRSRYNPELKYYGILEQNLNAKDYIISLIEKGVESILYTYI